ncbi:MAG: ATP-binding protein [Holosporales bacterium]|jgi:AAA15 family ATPase/GTPase|nr:ATP-binding protein [Holosporales bacterium]
MIIEFSVRNYKSFKEKIEFSMIADPEESDHSDRIYKLSRYGDSAVLPITAIYGGNASGKSNFIYALQALRNITLQNITPQIIDPFLLDTDTDRSKIPSEFDIKILVNDIIYHYVVWATHTEIIKEELKIVKDNEEEKLLYERDKLEVKLGGDFKDGQKELLELLINNKAIRGNQTFIKSATDLNFKYFIPILEWFKSLTILNPNVIYEFPDDVFEEKKEINHKLHEILPEIDTGISRIGRTKINRTLQVNPQVMKQIFNLQQGQSMNFKDPFVGDRGYISKEGNKILMELAGTFHKRSDGEDIFFGFGRESDGSKRVLTLLVWLFKIMSNTSNKILIIDEVDRGLHPELTTWLLEKYLSNCSNETQSQLVVTTHDVQLLDTNIMRRDEVWFLERKDDGHSDMCPLASYEDNGSSLKNYLQGKFGGIPHVVHPL